MADGGDVSTAPPTPFTSLRIVAASTEGKLEEKTVKIESNWGALVTAAKHHLPERFTVGDSPVIFFTEAFYNRNGGERKALWCFDEQTGRYPYIDYEDGSVVDYESILRTSWRFLRPSFPFPSGRLPPIISIRFECELVTIDPQGQLQTAPESAITDPSFVAFIGGLRSDTGVFWDLFGVLGYANAESDRLFEPKDVPVPKRFVFALLRDKDPVPRAMGPQDKYLFVFRRASCEVRVEDNCVRCAGPPLPDDLDRWEFPGNHFDTFVKDFRAAARR